MKLLDRIEKGIPNLRWYDFSLIKLASIFGILFLMTLISSVANFLLQYEWYIYLALMVIVSIGPAKKMFV